MVIKKILPKVETPPVKVDIERLINKGARIKEENREVSKSHQVLLNIPGELLEKIDEARHNSYKRSRTAWIIEAIESKLKSYFDILERKEKGGDWH